MKAGEYNRRDKPTCLPQKIRKALPKIAGIAINWKTWNHTVQHWVSESGWAATRALGDEARLGIGSSKIFHHVTHRTGPIRNLSHTTGPEAHRPFVLASKVGRVVGDRVYSWLCLMAGNLTVYEERRLPRDRSAHSGSRRA